MSTKSAKAEDISSASLEIVSKFDNIYLHFWTNRCSFVIEPQKTMQG